MPAQLIALILPLSLDTFAVSAALALGGLTRRERLRVSLLFTLCEGGTPIVGLLLGGPLGVTLGSAADYAAIGVLITFGLFTLLRDDDAEAGKVAGLAQARGRAALLLGLTISLDEIAVGFTLGLLRVRVLPVLLAIAGQAFVASQLGLRLGNRLSDGLREGAEKLAGAVLLGLGLVLLGSHLL